MIIVPRRTSPEALFLAENTPKPVSSTRTRWRSFPPDPLAALRGWDPQEEDREGKGRGRKRK